AAFCDPRRPGAGAGGRGGAGGGAGREGASREARRGERATLTVAAAEARRAPPRSGACRAEAAALGADRRPVARCFSLSRRGGALAAEPGALLPVAARR